MRAWELAAPHCCDAGGAKPSQPGCLQRARGGELLLAGLPHGPLQLPLGYWETNRGAVGRPLQVQLVSVLRQCERQCGAARRRQLESWWQPAAAGV